jgi:hypothetical protein
MRRDLVNQASRIASTALLLVASASACSKHTSGAQPVAAAAPEATVATTDAPVAIPHGLRKQLNLDIPVFVDGKEVAVLRYGELPPGVEPITIAANEHHAVRYYRISDYLKGIGVNVDRVKAVHFADKTDRIGAIEGSELRAQKDRFVFDFVETTGGKPQQAWDTMGLKTMLRIDDIFAVNVFVEQKPWEIDHAHHCYMEDDGCRPVVRFSSGDLMKGTRVYVDGKLVSYVKRRLLSDSAIASKDEDGDAIFSTEKYLASLGIHTANAKRINLLAGDKLVASASAKQWAADSDKLTFLLVPHGHGKVRAKIPADLQLKQEGTTDREVQVTAIQVFNRKEPRSVPLVSLDDVIDLGSIPGSVLAQAGEESGGTE